MDDKEASKKIVEIVKSEFPQAKICARSYDRTHARELLTAGADFQVRETFESAIQFGEATLGELGLESEEISQITEEIRNRDAERFALEMAAGKTEAGRSLLLGNLKKPAPLLEPQRETQLINAFSSLDTEKN